MKFKGEPGKRVYLGPRSLAVFDAAGFYATTKKAEIETLAKAKGVTEVKAKESAKKEEQATEDDTSQAAE